MVYRIKLTGYSLSILAMKNVIWLWDVVATQIDLFQLRIWNKLKDSLVKLKQDKLDHIKAKIQEKGIDSWED